MGRTRASAPAAVEVRPMGPRDVAPAVEAFDAAFAAMRARLGLPAAVPSAADQRRKVRRADHFRRTDPAGSWVAASGPRVVGLSQAFVREGLWVLSLLGVVPGSQGRGTGRQLLDAALTHGDPTGPGAIQASQDPAAVALYVSAGFDLHPTVAAQGTMRPGPGAAGVGGPADLGGLRVGGGTAEDLAAVAEIDRFARGAARTQDLAFLLGEPGNTLVMDGDQAYAVVTDEGMVTLGARAETPAARVLAAALDRTRPGATVRVSWITGAQQWAMAPLVGLGLRLQPSGPLMARGGAHRGRPYLPSGGYG